VAYIAWQQYRTAKTKLTLDLFDRRYKVWKALQDFLGKVIREADITDNDLRQFVIDVGDAVFLFDDDVPVHLSEVRQRAVSLHYCSDQYRSLGQTKLEGYDHAKVVDGMHRELEWLAGQLEPSKQLSESTCL
jgi:hypothetical protein